MYEKLIHRSMGTLNALELSRIIEETSEPILTKDNLNRLNKAIDLATILHSKQTRKNRDSYKKTPYIEHPLRNTLRLIRWGVNDTDILISSVLHDVVEDGAHEYCRLFLNKKVGDTSLARKQLSLFIKQAFGQRVAFIVKGVTLLPSSARENLDKKEINEIYKLTVKEAIESDQGIFLVKLSDFIDNATGLPHGDDSEFIIKQVSKYKPMVPIFLEELRNISSDSQLLVSKEGSLDIVFKLNYTQSFFDSFEWMIFKVNQGLSQ